MQLTFPHNAVVVVAGVPGAGKSTLIRRAVDRDGVVVVDTDDARTRGRGGRGLYVRTICASPAVLGGWPAVIHTRGTRAPARWIIRGMVLLRTRPGRQPARRTVFRGRHSDHKRPFGPWRVPTHGSADCLQRSGVTALQRVCSNFAAGPGARRAPR